MYIGKEGRIVNGPPKKSINRMRNTNDQPPSKYVRVNWQTQYCMSEQTDRKNERVIGSAIPRMCAERVSPYSIRDGAGRFVDRAW